MFESKWDLNESNLSFDLQIPTYSYSISSINSVSVRFGEFKTVWTDCSPHSYRLTADSPSKPLNNHQIDARVHDGVELKMQNLAKNCGFSEEVAGRMLMLGFVD